MIVLLLTKCDFFFKCLTKILLINQWNLMQLSTTHLAGQSAVRVAQIESALQMEGSVRPSGAVCRAVAKGRHSPLRSGSPCVGTPLCSFLPPFASPSLLHPSLLLSFSQLQGRPPGRRVE